VNAELIAENMGLELIESRSSHLDKYTNLITVKFHTKTKQQSISGTIFAREELRIVDFFGYKLDFEPTPFIIALQNTDKPGIIGRIGTLLGSNGINIAAMQWSRNKKGENAVSFVSVDGEVANEVLSQLRKMDGVLKVAMLKL
jgi:D-3-phosphoglycerate dehydrogenase